MVFVGLSKASRFAKEALDSRRSFLMALGRLGNDRETKTTSREGVARI